MSLRILATGTIANDPQARTSTKGKTFATSSVRSGSGDDATFINIIAFGEQAERLLELKKGDAVSIAGRGELKAWVAKDGTERPAFPSSPLKSRQYARGRATRRLGDRGPHRTRPTAAHRSTINSMIRSMICTRRRSNEGSSGECRSRA
jgi:Single-strand binding protein family